MNTKERIIDEALTLFSEKGYANVYVADIAERVGIKAPSLYKHYKNKQAIFDAIIDGMKKRFLAFSLLIKTKYETTKNYYKKSRYRQRI